MAKRWPLALNSRSLWIERRDILSSCSGDADGGAGGVREAVAVAGADDAISGVDVDLAGSDAVGGFIAHLLVGDDDDEVAGVDEMGGGTVDANLTAAPSAKDCVGLEAGAVGDVEDVDL